MHSALKNPIISRFFLLRALKNVVISKIFAHSALKNPLISRNFGCMVDRHLKVL